MVGSDLYRLTLLAKELSTGQWSQEQLLVVLDTVTLLVSRGRDCKPLKGILMHICTQVNIRLQDPTRLKAVPFFRRKNADFYMLLRLHATLKLPCHIDLLAELIEGYTHSNDFAPSKVPKFPVHCTYEELLSIPHRAGAVFLSNPDPTPELIQDYVYFALSDPPRNGVLYYSLLKKVSGDLFRGKLFPVLQRLIRRSGGMLVAVSTTVKQLSIDMTEYAKDLLFPSICDHLYHTETLPHALSTLHTVALKCTHHHDLVQAILSLRDQSESETVALLKALLQLQPHPNYTDQVLDFCLDRSHRLRSEDSKAVLIQCIGHYGKEISGKLKGFLEREGLKAGVVNVYWELGGKGMQATPGSPLQMAVWLSMGIPCPCPATIKSFLTESTSPFTALNPSSASESLAIARLCLLSLEVFPDSIVVYRKLAKGLLQDKTTREYILSHWVKSLSLALLCPYLVEILDNDDAYRVFHGNHRRLLSILMTNKRSSEDEIALVKLVCCKGIMERDRHRRVFRLFVRKWSELIRKIPLEIACTEYYLSALMCVKGNFGDFSRVSNELISYNLFSELKELNKTVESAIQDPEFIGILTLDSEVKSIAQSFTIPLTSPTEPLRAQELLHSTYLQSIQSAKYILQVYRLCYEVERWTREKQACFREEMITKGVFQAVKLSNLQEITEEAIDTMVVILRETPLFSRISHDIVKVLIAIERNLWKEKAAKRIINYINDEVSLEKITVSEGVILSHIMRAGCVQANTQLRSMATDLLARLVYERKADVTIGEIVKVAVQLLERYSGSFYSSLLTSLRQVMKPEDWRFLLTASISLPTASKSLLLDQLLQYEEGLPYGDWTEGPLWLLVNDESEEVAERALDVWHKFRMVLSHETVMGVLCNYLCDENEDIQSAAARSLASVWAIYPELTSPLLIHLFTDFRQKTQSSTGLPLLLRQLVPVLSSSTLETIDLILSGVSEVDSSHRDELISLGIELIRIHGKLRLGELFTGLYRSGKEMKGKGKVTAVLLLGHLAQHLQPNDHRVEPTIDLLLDALKTGNEGINRPIADCLSRLIAYRRVKSTVNKTTRAQDRKLIDDYLKVIFSSVNIEEKRGYAYAFASITKGLGIHYFDRFDVNSRFERVIRHGRIEEKAGLLVAIEALTLVLRTLFECYAIEYVAFVLECFEESQLFSQAQITLKAVFSGLSITGARRLIVGTSIRPPLLASGLDDSRWRSRAGTVEALGKLACSRTTEFLPETVSQIIRAFTSASPEVIQSACKALADIGSVITTPEILQGVPRLIRALSDASTLKDALIFLLETRFTHYVDIPALSLLVPILESGLKSHIPDVRKLAAQGVGGLMAVIPPSKGPQNYIDRLVVGLKNLLADPMPEVRNIAAQNMGQLCRFLGQKESKSIVQSLENTFLAAQIPHSERSGSVHAYSEITLRCQDCHLSTHIDYILDRTRADKSEVRAAFLGVLLFLPNYSDTHLDAVLPAVLSNLSHPSDEVRTLAVRLLQTLIRANSRRNVDQLLSYLEVGLFDADPKARQISLTLIGELLEKVETADRREGRRESTIPESVRCRTLAGVYILKSDWNKNSRSQADKVWQMLVENTPRVLPTLTPALVKRLVELAEGVVGETLTIVMDAVEESIKGGVFLDYVMLIEKELHLHPRGAAIILREVCHNTRVELLEEHWERLSKVVRQLLTHPNPSIITTAGDLFFLIYDRIPSSKDFLSKLLPFIDHPKAFRQLLRKKSPAIQRLVLPFLVKLPSRASILTEVSDLIADDLLTASEWRDIFPALVREAKESVEMMEAVILVVTGISRVKAVERCLETIAGVGLEVNLGFLRLINALVVSTKVDFSLYAVPILELFLPCIHLNEGKELVISTLKSILKCMRKEEMHRGIRGLMCELERAEKLECLLVPEGLSPFLGLMAGAMLCGPSEAQETAARTYAEAIRLSSDSILSTFSPQIAGPLLRLSLERLPFSVHLSLLSSLQALIKRSSESLIRYIPQLRCVLIKSIRSPDFPVRQAGLHFLPDFLVMETRPDLLLTDLCTFQNNTDITISSLKAVYEIAKKTQIPRKTALKCAQKLISEVESESNLTVLDETSRLISKLTPNSSELFTGIDAGEKGILVISGYLALVSGQNARFACDLFASAIGKNFENTVKAMVVVAKSQPKSACELVFACFSVLKTRLNDALELFLALPPEELKQNSSFFAELLLQIAKLVAENRQKGGNNSLNGLIEHIFRLNEGRGVRSMLRVLYLLPTEWQDELREYVYSLART